MRKNLKIYPSWLSGLPGASSLSPGTPGTAIRLLLVLFFILTSAGLFSLVLISTHSSAHADPTIIETYVPTPEPWGVSFDSGGNVWIADPQCDPNVTNPAPVCPPTSTGNLLEYASQGFNSGSQPLQNIPEPTTGYSPPFSSPFFLAFDSQGNIWFAEPVTNAIGKYNPSNGSWNQWTVPAPNASPFDLAFDQYGHLWFTELSANQVGEFDPATQQFQETPTPTPNSRPYSISGPDPTTNSMWFTENNGSVHQIARFTPTSSGGMANRIQEYHTNPSKSGPVTPHMLTFDHAGNIWWAEGFDGEIGKLVISQASPGTANGVTEYTVPLASCAPGCATHISGIAADSNNTVWFDDSLSGRVGAYVPGGGYFAMYNVDVNDPNQLNAHPHDGLAIDKSGNLWFSEEFAKKLGEGVQNGIPQPQPSPSSTPAPGGNIPTSPRWYFAEGSVGGGFTEWLTIENPDPKNKCQVQIQYLLTNSTPPPVNVTVNPNTRLTESVNTDLNTKSYDKQVTVSAIITVPGGQACTGVVAERPMYYTNFFNTSSGSDVLGATSPGKTFYFADMPTTPGTSNSFITILNPPGGSQATVTAAYYAGGKQVGQSSPLAVMPGTRGTINPPGSSQRVTAIVTSDQPVVVERPTYFHNFPAGQVGSISGAASVVGALKPTTNWLFAEGHVSSTFQENFVIGNLDPSNTANVTITLEYPTGATRAFQLTVGPQSQLIWDVNANSNGAPSADVSAEIGSMGASIVVEREMFFHYNNGHGLTATGTTDTTGMPGPANTMAAAFAEGYVGKGYNEWLTLQNPTGTDETIWVTLVNGYGHSYTFSKLVGKHSRLTVDITGVVYTYLYHSGENVNALEVSMFVQSTNGPFVAERPMYFNAGGSQGGSDVIGYIGG